MIPQFNNYNFLIADKHSVVRLGVSTIIRELFLNMNIYSTRNLIDTLNTLRQVKIDLLVLDANFEGANSISIISEIKTIRPDIKILVFSAYDENIYAIRYLNAGASGYLNKETSEDEIKHALYTIVSTGTFISENIKDKMLNNYFSKTINPLHLLSNREIEVAHLLIKGYSNLEILEMIDVKKETVSTYKRRLFEKLKIDNLPDLIKIFDLYLDTYYSIN